MTNPLSTSYSMGITTSIPFKMGKKREMSTFNFLIERSTGSPSHNQTRRKTKMHPTWKVKLSLFTDDMILYIEDPKDSTKKLLELINESSKVAGCKFNIQKSVAFLYVNNELTEKEIKKTIPFTITLSKVGLQGK